MNVCRTLTLVFRLRSVSSWRLGYGLWAPGGDVRPMITSPPAVRPRSLASSPGSSPAAELDQPTREGLVGAVIGLGAGLVLLMWWADTSPASLHWAGAWLTAAGRVTGTGGHLSHCRGCVVDGPGDLARPPHRHGPPGGVASTHRRIQRFAAGRPRRADHLGLRRHGS